MQDSGRATLDGARVRSGGPFPVGPTAAWLTAYVVLDFVGLLTVFPDYGIALFFPAAGVAAAWMLVTPLPRSVVVAAVLVLTTVVAVAAGVASPAAAVAFGVAHALQVAVIGAVLPRPGSGGRDPAARAEFELTTPGRFLSLTVAAIVATVVTAPVAMLGAALIVDRWDWLPALSWSVRNTSSIIVVASAVLVLRHHLRAARGLHLRLGADTSPRTRRTRLELGFLVLAGAVGGVLVFATSLGLASVFVVVVVTAWGAYRFGPPVAALACLGLSAMTLAAATRGAGPFSAIDNPVLQVGFVQAFCGLCATLAMLLALGAAEQERLTAAVTREARRAQESLQLFEALSASTTDAVAVIDGDDRVVWANDAATRYLPGLASVSGWRLTQVDGAGLDPAQLPHRRALAGQVVTHERVVSPAPSPDEERVVLAVSANSLTGFDNHDRPTAVVVLRDVTADEDDRAQLRQFAGVVAHDLRGPLSSMTGWTETALDEIDVLRARADASLTAADLATVSDALARVALRAGHMSELVEDLLRHAQAQDGSLRVDDVPAEELVRRAADHLGARGTVQVVGPLPTLRGDRGLLGQVVGNLISNGLKYVAPGTAPQVEVSGEQDDTSTTLRVCDNGVGVPRDQLPLIWAPFHRAHTDYPGTGLGLAICRAIVARHDGRIDARPRAEGGMTFEVTLPR